MTGISILKQWFKHKEWKAFAFQQECWEAYLAGKSGLLNAPTGSGKTFALALPILLSGVKTKSPKGVKAIWISPIKALSKDLASAIEEPLTYLNTGWKIATRTGDTETKERQAQKKSPPDFLITTPESLHLMLAQKDVSDFFKQLEVVVVDEWHELLGNKRGVQMELALSRLRGINPKLKIWGISATIGNLEEAKQVLLGSTADEGVLIKAAINKQIEVVSILPDEVEKYPWGGHLGIKLIHKIIPLIEQATTSLIFTNTRSQTEIWYQQLIHYAPQLAGAIAMHHGSLSGETRAWVEDALHRGSLKAVVCTSSLDLGVDFRPVDQVIQIGGPKGVARFLQRAGRSGHQPNATSRIYFLPTHALELMEASALRKAIQAELIESKPPVIRAFDVLCQYLVTLAIGEGFDAEKIGNEVLQTHCFNSMSADEWNWVLQFIKAGGDSLQAYDEFKKVEVVNNLHAVTNKKIAMMHRLSIGTIVSDQIMQVKYLSGGNLGTIEEYFISRLNIGDVFWFAGRSLELVQLKDMTALVRKSTAKKALIPSWAGGRMPLSSRLSEQLRLGLTNYIEHGALDVEFQAIEEILEQQKASSILPDAHTLLIEKLTSKDGYHVFIYPFEGRFVHEGLASLVGYRISKIVPISFSIAFNDYGFELLSDQPIPIEEALGDDLFTDDDLFADMLYGINAMEMAKRKFRDIAHISGLVFGGYPGKAVKSRHLQASSAMFFKVFMDNEPNNLLLKQAYEEVMFDQLEEVRLRNALKRIGNQRIEVIELQQASPFAFPILVERLREKMTTEQLEERIKKMKLKMAD
ncbi:MAG: ligase-associated DNA damage response DEXH box helicase [Bacteroidetes bacterium]|nr:MAG: ligase-associated DNA damage response DEXH box helicase [Bacteroidota bacterium]